MASVSGPKPHPYFVHRDVERNWLYTLEFSGAGISQQDVIAISGNAQDVSVPAPTTDPVNIDYLNLTMKAAGRAVVGELTATYYSSYDQNFDAADAIERWFQKVFDINTEVLGLVDEYKANADLVIYNPKLQVYKTYTMAGVFPIDPGQRTYSWTNSAPTLRTARFSVDKIYDPRNGGSFG
jgi:hypothetical protein